MYEQPNSVQLQRGLLEIDIDPAAERYGVQSRRDGALYWMGPKPASSIAVIIVPLAFVGNNDLQVIIYDESGVYNAAIVDKVQPDLIDAKMVTLNP